jgi:DNA-binding MarR family transcriptional regulator
MRVFERMRALRAFENQHLLFLRTGGNHHLISEIGHHQAKGKPLTLKQLFLLDIGSIATVQRHLRKLRELGLVLHRRATGDRRVVELTLSPKCVRLFAKYDTLMTLKPPAGDAVRRSGEPRHVCGLCDSDSGGRNLLATFLARGLARGDKCVLVAPANAQEETLAELRRRRKSPGGLVVSEGYGSADTQFAFLKRVSREAKQAGQAMCLATNMSWTLSKNVRIDAILDTERRFDALAGRLPLTGLCIYDARHFSGGDLLRAVKCHRDHARYPIVLG